MRYNSNHWNCVDDNDYNVGVIYWSIFALSRVFDFLEQINPHSSPHAAYRIPSCKLWEGKRNERLHMIEWLLVFAVPFESRVKYLFMAVSFNLILLGVSFNRLHKWFTFLIILSCIWGTKNHSFIHLHYALIQRINCAHWRRCYFLFFLNFSIYTKMINCLKGKRLFQSWQIKEFNLNMKTRINAQQIRFVFFLSGL